MGELPTVVAEASGGRSARAGFVGVVNSSSPVGYSLFDRTLLQSHPLVIREPVSIHFS